MVGQALVIGGHTNILQTNPVYISIMFTLKIKRATLNKT